MRTYACGCEADGDLVAGSCPVHGRPPTADEVVRGPDPSVVDESYDEAGGQAGWARETGGWDGSDIWGNVFRLPRPAGQIDTAEMMASQEGMGQS